MRGRSFGGLRACAIVFFLSLGAAAQCVGAHGAEKSPGNPEATLRPGVDYVEREILVKLTPSAAAEYRQAGRIPATLQALNVRYAVSDMRPSFRAVKKAMEDRGLSFGRRLQGIRERFPRRSARAPRGVAIPDLSLWYKVTLGPGRSVPDAVRAYGNNPAVEAAQPNHIHHAHAIPPDDPYYSSSDSWGQGYDDLWGLKLIECEDAWSSFASESDIGDGVVVAVVDTGVDYTHEDLTENIWQNLAEDADGDGQTLEYSGGEWILDPDDIDGVDDDGNGVDDDLVGWDYVNEDNDPQDGRGHGTHCSGTIAAVTDNATGVAGISWNSEIMGVKGLDDNGSGTDEDLAECIAYAADNGADVISNSWGGGGSNPYSEAAVTYAYGLGCVVVFSAGNDDADIGSAVPNAMDEVITVASTTQDDVRSYFSTYGENVDICAPGSGYQGELGGGGDYDHRNILSCTPLECGFVDDYADECEVAEGYYRLAGTSMACPHVSGVAALLLSMDGTLTPDDVKLRITSSADDITASNPDYIGLLGAGRLNAFAALSAGEDPNIVLTGCDPVFIPEDTDQDVEITVRNFGYDAQSVTAELSCSDPLVTVVTSSSTIGDIDSYDEADNSSSPFTIRVDSAAGFNDDLEFEVAITATTTDGSAYSKTLSLTLHSGIESSWEIDTYRTVPTMADIDGDGTGEIIAVGSDEVTVYDSSGGEMSGWPVNVGSLSRIVPTAVGDIDGDSEMEIVTCGDESVSALESDGSLCTGWPVDLAEDVGPGPALADFDGDCVPEIVAVTADGDIHVLDGAGSELTGWPVACSDDVAGPPAVGDLDGDGEVEVVLATSGGEVYAYHDDGSAVSGWPVSVTATSGMINSGPSFGDVDGDGTREVVLGSFDDDEMLYCWNDDGTALSGWPLSDYSVDGIPPALADLDDDGDMEIVFGPYSMGDSGSAIVILHGDGTAVTGWPVTLEDSPRNLLIADVDGDGGQDIVFSAGNRVYAYSAGGSACAGWPVELPDPDARFYYLALGDLDDDGSMEMAASATSSAWGDRMYLFDLGEGTYADNTSGWPLLRGDRENTGCAAALPGCPDCDLFVDASFAGSCSDGSRNHPYVTIQDAIDAASGGMRVCVAAGSYAENVTLKDGVDVIGVGADVTEISASSGNAVVGADDSVIAGFTITNNYSTRAGVYCAGSSPTIYRCIIRECGEQGIYCGGGTSPRILNCTILENDGYGGIGVDNGATPEIINCIVTRSGGRIGAGIYSYSGSPTILFSDVWNNSGGNYDGCAPGAGCISAPPLLIPANLRLAPPSPCRNAGAPGAAWRDENGSRNDMGWTGGPSICFAP